jgi:hypothetical protein
MDDRTSIVYSGTQSLAILSFADLAVSVWRIAGMIHQPAAGDIGPKPRRANYRIKLKPVAITLAGPTQYQHAPGRMFDES